MKITKREYTTEFQGTGGQACEGWVTAIADGSGIRRVVLAATAGHTVGRDELRRHQPDGVAVLPEQPRPVVCAGACFHADQARRQLCDKAEDLKFMYQTNQGIEGAKCPFFRNKAVSRHIELHMVFRPNLAG